MKMVKIKRVKKTKRTPSAQEKILAGLGVGSSLMGAGMAQIQPARSQPPRIVSSRDTSGESAAGKVKGTLKRIFGVPEAKAANVDIYYTAGYSGPPPMTGVQQFNPGAVAGFTSLITPGTGISNGDYSGTGTGTVNHTADSEAAYENRVNEVFSETAQGEGAAAEQPAGAQGGSGEAGAEGGELPGGTEEGIGEGSGEGVAVPQPQYVEPPAITTEIDVTNIQSPLGTQSGDNYVPQAPPPAASQQPPQVTYVQPPSIAPQAPNFSTPAPTQPYTEVYTGNNGEVYTNDQQGNIYRMDYTSYQGNNLTPAAPATYPGAVTVTAIYPRVETQPSAVPGGSFADGQFVADAGIYGSQAGDYWNGYGGGTDISGALAEYSSINQYPGETTPVTPAHYQDQGAIAEQYGGEAAPAVQAGNTFRTDLPADSYAGSGETTGYITPSGMQQQYAGEGVVSVQNIISQPVEPVSMPLPTTLAPQTVTMADGSVAVTTDGVNYTDSQGNTFRYEGTGSAVGRAQAAATSAVQGAADAAQKGIDAGTGFITGLFKKENDGSKPDNLNLNPSKLKSLARTGAIVGLSAVASPVAGAAYGVATRSPDKWDRLVTWATNGNPNGTVTWTDAASGQKVTYTKPQIQAALGVLQSAGYDVSGN